MDTHYTALDRFLENGCPEFPLPEFLLIHHIDNKGFTIQPVRAWENECS
jgi:hypothetical protein